jgi:hypothetical protein
MHPLRQAGIDITFQPKGPHQRLAKPFSADAVIIDGQLFSAYMPRALWAEFPWPPYGASEEQALAYEQLFNERAHWRYQRLTRPDADGTARWQSPFDAGLLRSRHLPSTMRGSRNATRRAT